MIRCAYGRDTPALSISASVPEVAEVGTSTTRRVGVLLEISSVRAPRRASRTPSSAVPAIVMAAGGITVVGVTEVMVGTATTVRSLADSSTAPSTPSSMRPVLAPFGTVTSTVMSETMRKVAGTLPTLADFTVASPAPVTVTTAPGLALGGEKPVTVAEPPAETAGLGDSCVAVGAAESPPPPPQPTVSATSAQAPRRPVLRRTLRRSDAENSGMAAPRD